MRDSFFERLSIDDESQYKYLIFIIIQRWQMVE